MISVVVILRNSTPASKLFNLVCGRETILIFSVFLRFKLDVKINRGTFGKVTVERVISGGTEPIFEFNLQKVSVLMETVLSIFISFLCYF